MSIALEEIKRKHPAALCETCPLFDKPCAPTIGPKNADTTLVSRSPGYHEAMVGKPFSGPSGKVLDHLLKMNGRSRNDVKVTNVVLCAPDAGKIPPEAIKACAPRVREDIASSSLVIAAGSEAVNLLLGRGAIDRYRGYRIAADDGRTYIATNNPALVLRDDSTFPNLVKDFRRAFHPLPEPKLPEVDVIEDVDEAIRFFETIPSGSLVAGDIESRGGLTHTASLVSIQFAVSGLRATVIGERGGCFTDGSFLAALRTFLERVDLQFLWHNGKYDVKVLRGSYDIKARVDHDTLLMSYALDERGGVHGLEYLLMEEFGWPNYEPDSVKLFKKDGIVRDYDELHNYAGWDAAGTYQLYELFNPKLDAEEVREPYNQLLLEGCEAIIQMELAGFTYNVERAADAFDYQVGPELKQLTKDMRDHLQNQLYLPTSSKQNAVLFYDTWKVKHSMQERPDKKRSCDESALLEIQAGRYKVLNGKDSPELRAHIEHFVDLLLRHRELQKQASTYIVSLIKRAINDPERKVYTELLLHGTTTGRLSSRNPNLQNITRYDPNSNLPNIRSFFEAPAGFKVVQADYSQAELRCIAQFSGDPILTRVYTEGLDLHNITAERFFGPNYVKEQRSKAKNMNFGMFYRQSAQTFQEKHGIPIAEAEEYISWAKKEFRQVWLWEEEVEKQIRAQGYLRSPFGRKRRFYLLTPENLQATFREGINFYPQTTASDLTLRSVILLCRSVDWNHARIVLTVHDSIIALVREEYLDTYQKLCLNIMQSRAKDELGWKIPMVADIQIGQNWGELN